MSRIAEISQIESNESIIKDPVCDECTKKSRGQESMSHSTSSSPIKNIILFLLHLYFSIISPQDHPCHWGYLNPQNELEASVINAL
jgi:hypothetical protein